MNQMMRMFAAMAVLTLAASQVQAGGVKYTANEEGTKWVELGGRIQLQYHWMEPDGEDSEDELRFRRFRPYIEGSIHEDWYGKFQWDMGKSDIAIKDAYFTYTGFDLAKVSIGNKAFPFSREFLTSSKKQQLVERTFVGDHNYGTPDRQAGVHLAGNFADKFVTWDVSATKAAIDPSHSKLDFDTVVQFDKGSDWYEGEMVGGRLELFPTGYFKPEQGDFKRELKTAVAVGAFYWQNDEDDVEEGSGEVEDVVGLELSAALRVMGISIDAEYNTFDTSLYNGMVESGMLDDEGEPIMEMGAISGGLYDNGETTLENYAIEGGVMVVPEKLEIVGGYQAQDADGYDETWTRTSVGLNCFVKKHDIKYQLTYRMGENLNGKDGHDEDEVFLQAQYVF